MQVAVAGIDTSLTGTGVVDREGLRFKFESKAVGMDLYKRRARLRGLARRVVDTATNGGVDLVVIEQPAYSKAMGQMHDRSGLWWLIVDELIEQGTPTIEVTPSSLKKFATGKGNANKGDMRMALFKRTGLDVADDNKVDAWWLRAFGAALAGHPVVDLPKLNLETLAGYELPSRAAVIGAAA